MSSGRRGRRGEEDEEYSEGEGNGSDSQEQSEIDNRGVDDGDGGDGDGDGDGGAEDSPKTLSEVHAMLTTLLSHFNVPLPTTRIEDDAKRKLTVFEGSNRR